MRLIRMKNEIMRRFQTYNQSVVILFCSILMSSCAMTQESLDQGSRQQDMSELLAVRARPTNISELKEECRCMDDKIDEINNFTKKMNNSKFGFLYQSLGRQKVSTIKTYKTSLNCQIIEQ